MAIFTVTTEASGVADDGETSFREAINEASANGDDSDVIRFAAGVQRVEVGGIGWFSDSRLFIDGDRNDDGRPDVTFTATASNGFAVRAGEVAISGVRFADSDIAGGHPTPFIPVNGDDGADGPDLTWRQSLDGVRIHGSSGTRGQSGVDVAPLVVDGGELALSRSIFENNRVTAASGGFGGVGGDGGDMADAPFTNSTDGRDGGGAGRGGDGGDGGDASAGVLVLAGRATLRDVFFGDGQVAEAGEGGDGGRGGDGGAGGRGGEGDDGDFPFKQPDKGGTGGDGGDAGRGGDGGSGGSASGGVVERGPEGIPTEVIWETAVARAPGAEAAAGERGQSSPGGDGGARGAGGPGGEPGAFQDPGETGDAGATGIGRRFDLGVDNDHVNGVGHPLFATDDEAAEGPPDVARSLIFVAATRTNVEEGQSIAFHIVRFGHDLRAETVRWRIDGLADHDIDNARTRGVVTLEAGEDAARVRIKASADGLSENIEGLQIKIFGGQLSGRATLGTDTLLGSILDGDGGTDGRDVLIGSDENNDIRGGGRNDRIEGRGGLDDLLGDDGKDIIKGGRGDDSIFGGAGADDLYGGAGRDVIEGDAGADALTGGGGADIFGFRADDSGPEAAGRDRILDFKPREDHIRPFQDDDEGFDFIGEAAFTGTERQIRAVDRGARWLVLGDEDGDGAADVAIWVIAQTNRDLSAGDFLG